MILSAHQAHFCPWPGYIDKIARCDQFVILDHVQYETENFQNRNRIKLPSGEHWLTVPLAAGSRDDAICDKRVSYGNPNWPSIMWRTIEQGYGKAPHFARYAPALQALLLQRWDRLLDLDLAILRQFLDWLGIDTPLVLSSTLGLTSKKSELIAELCERMGADTFLGGMGGSQRYFDMPLFEARGVRVIWQAFALLPYPQRFPRLGFLPRLSTLDLLFNCGPDSRALLLGEPPASAVGGAS